MLWDIDEKKIGSVAEEIRREGGDAHPYVVDCSKREEVYRVAGRVRDEVGNVAVLINNAGIAPEKAFVNGDLKDEEIEKTYAVNALALYWVKQLLHCILTNHLQFFFLELLVPSHPYFVSITHRFW